MFVLILGLLWASEVYSQGTCQIVAGVQSSDTHSKKDWRLNIRHTPTNLNFSQAEYAATRAAALWNEATNSGYFNYRGSTGIVSLPDSYADCVAQGRLYHLVTFESNSVASLGRETKRCIDSNGRG